MCTVKIKSFAKLIFASMVVVVANINFSAFAREIKAAPLGRLAFAPKVRVNFYPVEGRNADELTSSMFERGPIGHGNKRFFAYTLWHLQLKPSQSKQILKCNVSVLLPFLWPQQDRPLKIEEQWSRFYSSTVRHESNHVKMAMRTCRQLNSANLTDAHLIATSERLKKRDQAYDLATKHGLLEGVKLL